MGVPPEPVRLKGVPVTVKDPLNVPVYPGTEEPPGVRVICMDALVRIRVGYPWAANSCTPGESVLQLNVRNPFDGAQSVKVNVLLAE